MLKKEELYSNVNTEFCISQAYLVDTRHSLNKYIKDICSSIRVSTEIASTAMCYANYFFVRKCYLNYDRQILACAAILLSSKQESSKNKFNEISNEYFKLKAKTINPLNPSIFKQEDNQKIKDKISEYEIILLKALNFQIKIELPYDYIYVYSAILYPNNETDVVKAATYIANDSFFTYANNVFPYYVVAISCIVISARILQIPSIFDKDFPSINILKRINIENISIPEFEAKLLSWENKPEDNFMEVENEYFDKLNIAEKLYPGMKLEDIRDCIDMILKFYNGVKKLMESKNKV